MAGVDTPAPGLPGFGAHPTFLLEHLKLETWQLSIPSSDLEIHGHLQLLGQEG